MKLFKRLRRIFLMTREVGKYHDVEILDYDTSKKSGQRIFIDLASDTYDGQTFNDNKHYRVRITGGYYSYVLSSFNIDSLIKVTKSIMERNIVASDKDNLILEFMLVGEFNTEEYEKEFFSVETPFIKYGSIGMGNRDRIKFAIDNNVYQSLVFDPIHIDYMKDKLDTYWSYIGQTDMIKYMFFNTMDVGVHYNTLPATHDTHVHISIPFNYNNMIEIMIMNQSELTRIVIHENKSTVQDRYVVEYILNIIGDHKPIIKNTSNDTSIYNLLKDCV